MSWPSTIYQGFPLVRLQCAPHCLPKAPLPPQPQLMPPTASWRLPCMPGPMAHSTRFGWGSNAPNRPSPRALAALSTAPGGAPPASAFGRAPPPVHGGVTTTGPDATHPPAICQNSGGGGGRGWIWGGLAGRCRGGISAGGGGSQGGGACARPTTTTCIPPGGLCVWGLGGREVCMR